MSERNLNRWMILIILSAFLLGAFLLENMGIQYVSEGGSPILKIHVYSYLTMGIFALLILWVGLFNLIKPLNELKKAWWLAMVSMLAVILYGFMRFGTSGLAYLIDTIFIPLVLVPIVYGLSDTAKNRLLALLGYLLFLNACIAIIELILAQSIVAVEIGSFFNFPFDRLFGASTEQCAHYGVINADCDALYTNSGGFVCLCYRASPVCFWRASCVGDFPIGEFSDAVA